MNNCCGSQSRISTAAAASELTKSPGRLRIQPIATMVTMTDERTADACQPVAAT